jgi:hypothetical protein
VTPTLLTGRNTANAWLAADSESGPQDDLIGHSITYRIAVGPRTGQKLFTLQTLPCRRPGRISHWLLRRTPAPVRRPHRRPQFAVRRNHAVEPGQVHAWQRHQCRQPRHQIQRFRHDMRGAVPIRRLAQRGSVRSDGWSGCAPTAGITAERCEGHLPAYERTH